MTKNGEPIRDAWIKGGVNPHIDYKIGFAEWEAATEAGLDLWLWDNDVYPKKFKVKIIAFHRLRKLVENHTQDAMTRDANKRSKSKGR